ncbi:putative signal transducing protein [Christensenella intestinihominis]|uniref:putative signal transducing protein n=2 Tax=Christensenella intestinihominis TaxID=1851429 RepID=UPI00155FCEFD|nr:DUF2007 domain-containing protein [Christensenella intestinihominis]
MEKGVVENMPFCPNCKTEYDEGYTVCADCGARLTDKLPREAGKPPHAPEEKTVRYAPMKRTFLVSTQGPVESAMITDILGQHGIRAFVQQKEAGNYLNVYSGFSIYGEEIYVDEADYEAAAALAGEFLSQPETAVDLPEKNPGRRRVRILIGSFVAVWLVFLVITLVFLSK